MILDAAAGLMRERGLAATTTRQIAAAAGFSEATLYKHFADKADLMVAVLHERSGGFAQLTAALDGLAGAATLEAGLTAVARAAILLYHDNFPMLASVFSDRTLLSAHQDGLRRHGAGPHRGQRSRHRRPGRGAGRRTGDRGGRPLRGHRASHRRLHAARLPRPHGRVAGTPPGRGGRGVLRPDGRRLDQR